MGYLEWPLIWLTCLAKHVALGFSTYPDPRFPGGRSVAQRRFRCRANEIILTGQPPPVSGINLYLLLETESLAGRLKFFCRRKTGSHWGKYVSLLCTQQNMPLKTAWLLMFLHGFGSKSPQKTCTTRNQIQVLPPPCHANGQFLIGGMPTPLKIWQSIGMINYSQYMKKKNKQVPNHQPADEYSGSFWVSSYSQISSIPGWWFQPLWKKISQLGWLFSIYGKINFMFQTTNQIHSYW